jgi:hypothetical protein
MGRSSAIVSFKEGVQKLNDLPLTTTGYSSNDRKLLDVGEQTYIF